MPALRGLRRDGGSRTVPKVLSRTDDDGGVPNATRIPPIDVCSDGVCGLRGLLRGLVLKSDRNLCFAKSLAGDIGRYSDRLTRVRVRDRDSGGDGTKEIVEAHVEKARQA